MQLLGVTCDVEYGVDAIFDWGRERTARSQTIVDAGHERVHVLHYCLRPAYVVSCFAEGEAACA